MNIQLKNSYLSFILYALLMLNTAYVFLWNTFGLVLTNVIQYILVVILGFYLIKYFRVIKKNNFINWIISLFLLMSLSFFFTGSSATTQYKSILLVLLTVIPFYIEYHKPKLFKIFIVIIAFVSICMFFYSLTLMRYLNENAYGGGYYSLVTLPIGLYLLKDKKQIYQVAWCSSVLVLVMLSIKRGDILACILAILVYYITLYRSNGKFNFKFILAIITLISIGYFLFQYMETTSDLFSNRMQNTREGNSSERDYIYERLWNYYTQEASILEQLFGGGFDKTTNIIGNRAHSDWLELLIDTGILGFIIYAASMISLYKSTKYLDYKNKSIVLLILTIWFIKSIFSMFIYSEGSIFLFLMVGYIFNTKKKHQYSQVKSR